MRDTFSIYSVTRERRMLADRELSSVPIFLRKLNFLHKIHTFIVGQCRLKRGDSFAVNFNSFRILFPSSAWKDSSATS